MKKITKKQINAALQNLNSLRHDYRVQGSSGDVEKYQQTLEYAIIAWDEDKTPKIYLKGYEEAVEEKVYNQDFDYCFDITTIIEDFIKGYHDRATCIDKIQTAARCI